MPTFSDRLAHAWSAFNGKNEEPPVNYGSGFVVQNPGRSYRPQVTSKSILGTIFNRLAVDASGIEIRHVIVDENESYLDIAKEDGLNEVLRWVTNEDQTARQFFQDVYETMFNEGVVAIVPTEANVVNQKTGNVMDIKTMRVGHIIQWYPDAVRMKVYNAATGELEEIILPKSYVAIVQNPFYTIMNEPNSTLQRLRKKLALLDIVDEKNGSDKLDLIIQLPYVLKGDVREAQAEKRRANIETQLSSSKYGIAYIDGTEHITQLNRAVESNLDKQVEYLTTQLYNQLGLTPTIFDGTATEATMLNYQVNTLEPIVAAVCDAMEAKFLTKTARTRGHRLMYFKDPFKLVPVSQLADIADKFTRNEIMSPNEMRAKVGMIPSGDPDSDILRNRNISAPNGQSGPGIYVNEEGRYVDAWGNYVDQYGNPVDENGEPLQQQTDAEGAQNEQEM